MSEWDDPDSPSWDEHASKPSLPSNGGYAPEAAQALGTSLTAVSAPPRASAPTTLPSEASDPWYSRVLQAWGVVLLLWAAVILGRSLLLIFVSGSGRPEGSLELVTSVISVLLLVPGAAGLFLMLDFGRYLRDLRFQTPGPSVQSPLRHSASPISLRLRRFWHRPLETATIRSGT